MSTAKNMHEELTLRMLGQSVSFTRSQWEELLTMLAPETVWDRDDARNLARRIKEILGGEAA